jgi:serine/threonine protein kinase
MDQLYQALQGAGLAPALEKPIVLSMGVVNSRGYVGVRNSAVFGNPSWRFRMNACVYARFTDPEALHFENDLSMRRPIYRVRGDEVPGCTGEYAIVKWLPRHALGQDEADFTCRFAGWVAPTVYSVHETSDGIELLMEAADGQLRTPLLSDVDRLFVVYQLATHYAALHEEGIGQYDAKPANVVVFTTKEGIDLRLIDFGMACEHEDLDLHVREYGQPYLGTPGYLPPEFLDPTLYVDAVRPELFSFGMLVRALHQPHSQTLNSVDSAERFHSLGRHGFRKEVLGIDQRMHPVLAEILATTTEIDPHMRPDSFDEIAMFVFPHL